MLLNEEQAMIQRERIKRIYPDVHVDIHFDNQSGVLAHTLWIWRGGDAKAIHLKSEAEVSHWLQRQSKPLLDPELRNTVGKAVYAAWCKHHGGTSDLLDWDCLEKEWQELEMEIGEAAIVAFFVAQPYQIELLDRV